MFPASEHPDAAIWRAAADELSQFVMAHLVNRSDVWGVYIPPRSRNTPSDKARTAPARDDRGFRLLTTDEIREHFRADAVIGLHAQSDAGDDGQTSRFCGFDIDAHGESSGEAASANLKVAMKLLDTLQGMGAHPLLEYSCNRGGFHIWVRFSMPLPTRDVHAWAKLVLAQADVHAEVFPKQGSSGIGNWLRLPGPHHTLSYFSRFGADQNAAGAVASFLSWEATSPHVVPVAPSRSQTTQVQQRAAAQIDYRRNDGHARLAAYIKALPTALRDGEKRDDIAYQLAARCLEELSRFETIAVVHTWNRRNFDLLSDEKIEKIVRNAAVYRRVAP